MNPVRRFVLFFTILFLPTAALDVWTTELGRQRGNMAELNPSGFMPLTQSILGEIPLLLGGAGLVALGAWLRRETLLKAPTLKFREFRQELWFKGSYLAALLLFAPVAIAALRVTAISNNLMHLRLGWSAWDRWLLHPVADWMHLPVGRAYPVMCFIIAMLGLVPVTWVVYQVAKFKFTGHKESVGNGSTM